MAGESSANETGSGGSSGPGSPRTEGGLGMAVAASLFCLVAHLVVFLPPKLVDLLAGREKIYETLGAALFLVASIFFWRAWGAARVLATGEGGSGAAVRVRSEARWRRVAFVCLAILLFVACGEELSWGQHWLGFETPDAIKELNAQEEVNLHNLWLIDSYDPDGGKKSGWRALLNSNRLFDYFMITLLWLIPFAHGRLPPLRSFIDRFGGPVVTPWLGLALLADFGASALMEILVVDGDPLLHLAVSETRELGYALLCALAGADLLARERRRNG